MTHEDATHGPAPMGRVDTEPMHRAVDALAAALHDYVGTAVGVRAEFGAAEADEDPLVLALESKVGHLNAALFDTLHSSLGMHPDLTSSVWEPEGLRKWCLGRGSTARPRWASGSARPSASTSTSVSKWLSDRPWCWGSAPGSPSTRSWSWGSAWQCPASA